MMNRDLPARNRDSPWSADSSQHGAYGAGWRARGAATRYCAHAAANMALRVTSRHAAFCYMTHTYATVDDMSRPAYDCRGSMNIGMITGTHNKLEPPLLCSELSCDKDACEDWPSEHCAESPPMVASGVRGAEGGG